MVPFHPPDSAQRLLKDRYLQPQEDWEGLCRRVAAAAAKAETEKDRATWEKRFFELMYSGEGLPNTPALINLGADRKGSVAACFSFRPEDNMTSIMEVSRLAAMTLKFGGGAGFELSLLRPAGFPVQSTHKYAMGPVGVMKFYNAVGDMITQAGVRKAALIAILRVDHPDVVRFIHAKAEDKELANFNISVSVPDSFMKKLTSQSDRPHIARFNGAQYFILPDGEPILRSERGPRKVLSVTDLWMLICKAASSNGDPGIFFVDHANRGNQLADATGGYDSSFYLHGTNPCGELPLETNGACVLGSIDLAKFVSDKEIDSGRLTAAFRTMTRMLDDMTSVSDWPDPIIKETVSKTRRIGVGVMGFASTLDKLGIKYGSDECVKIIDIIGSLREMACAEESKQLAKERGPYPASVNGEKHRNVARTVIAPTGTVAMIANTSWSIEPHLYWAFEERRNDQRRFRFLPAAIEALGEEKLEELQDRAGGNLSHLNNVIQSALPPHMILARDVTPLDHLKVVSAWQRYTESAISKTVVAPCDILTPEKVSEIYTFAWENKLKGLTVYPEGSRDGEPMSIGRSRPQPHKFERPKKLPSHTTEHECMIGQKIVKAYAIVGHSPDNPNEPMEVFLKHPHVQDLMAIQFIDVLTRMISLALRHRRCSECGAITLPLGQIIKQLIEADGQSMYSVPSIFVRALGEYIDQGEPVGNCPVPDCKGRVTIVEGCSICTTCGWRACG